MTKIEKEAIRQKRKSMTKKQFLEEQKKNRVLMGMNTGTRTHKTKKDYNRKEKISHDEYE